jgi:hypothetical protein
MDTNGGIAVSTTIIPDQVLTQFVIGVLAMFTSMVGLLTWLIKRQAEQVEHLTDRFSSTLESTIIHNTEGYTNMTSSVMTLTSAVTELTTTVREHMATTRDTNHNILDAIGKSSR